MGIKIDYNQTADMRLWILNNLFSHMPVMFNSVRYISSGDLLTNHTLNLARETCILSHINTYFTVQCLEDFLYSQTGHSEEYMTGMHGNTH